MPFTAWKQEKRNRNRNRNKNKNKKNLFTMTLGGFVIAADYLKKN